MTTQVKDTPVALPQKTLEQRVAELEARIHLLSQRLYIGFFRYGNRPPATKVFRHDGTRRDADTKFRDHCTDMGYKFCGVYPYVVDLDEQLKMRNDEDSSFNMGE